jgi:hypothetical protein
MQFLWKCVGQKLNAGDHRGVPVKAGGSAGPTGNHRAFHTRSITPCRSFSPGLIGWLES